MAADYYQAWLDARAVVRAARDVASAWRADNSLSKPGTSIGYLRDAVTAYDQRNHDAPSVATPATTTDGEGWIACSERMPDTAAADTGEFIVLLNGEDVTHGWLRGGAWLILDAECFDPVEMVPPMVLNSVVTHWRPLPAPPAANPAPPTGEKT